MNLKRLPLLQENEVPYVFKTGTYGYEYLFRLLLLFTVNQIDFYYCIFYFSAFGWGTTVYYDNYVMKDKSFNNPKNQK